jgi:DivIVA domain-containing protein
VKWFILLVGIIVLCFVVALMLGLGGGMGRPTSSLSHEPLPEGDLHDEDLAELRFDVTARGYRMSQVDGVVDRLRRELREKDEHIAFLRSGSVRTPAETAAGEPAADEPAAGEPAAEGPAADEPRVSHDEHERAQPHDSPKA